MTNTNTASASGAAIQRYKIGYHADEWGQRSSTPSGIPDASGSWVRYEDHIAELAAGQAKAAQPVAATQQAGERVYAFRRKGLADFCTCDEARYEELSNKPHLFETRIFYTAPQPSPTPHGQVPAGEPTMPQPAPQQEAHNLAQALTDRENQPNQYGVEFGMSGTYMHFKIGNQLFKLAYEPDEQEEFDFMKRMLVNAFTTFTHDVKTAHGDALSDAVRVPLNSLHADAAYLIGRLREGSMPYARVIEIIRERIDAASPTAQAAGNVPAPPPPPECETEAEKRAFAFGWFKALESERMKTESVLEDAARYRWLAASCISTSEHWGGRWSIIIDGPAPKSHDSEDDFDAAVDAARKQARRKAMSGTGGDNGWLEAAIAWEVCASLHRQYCKGKDAFFTTRQSDFVKHAENARGRASHGQAPATAQADSVQEDVLALLQEVASCFTCDDDLPDNLLPRIDAVLAARKQGGA